MSNSIIKHKLVVKLERYALFEARSIDSLLGSS